MTYPSGLNRAMNGRLPAADLVLLEKHNGGADVRLVRPAARSWAALTAAARLDGHVLRTQYPNSSYRPYADQQRIFLERYTPHRGWAPRRRKWRGQWWSKNWGKAAAAVPGRSNHGLGLAVDTGEEGVKRWVRGIDLGTRDWLIDNAHRFGFSAELQSERWHWRYFAGDDIPAEVLDFERTTRPDHTRTVGSVLPEESMILLTDSQTGTVRVAVPGEGSAVVDDPDHWREVIAAGRATGVYESRHMQTLIDKIRAEKSAPVDDPPDGGA
ncbi:MAG: D-alanyl-D-alanine carboxypeptidase family protein [Actinomycetota bacterium]